MSALTKVFVILLVVLTIVLTAGMVVWVNRQTNFAATLKTQTDQLKAAKAESSSLRDQTVLLANEKTQVQQALQKQIDSEKQANDQLHAAVVDRDTQIAQLNANLAQTTVAQKSATDALAVAQKTVDQTTSLVDGLRKSLVDLEKRNAEASFAINDWTNKYEVANRQWRDAEEQVTQLQSDNKNLRETLHKAGVAENSAPTINNQPMVRVEGVVRSKQDIGGVPYATISVGSADQVAPGMQFKVIDPSAKDPFLGYLVVDRVEPNQAIGHLTGPRIGEIHPGVEVRTQL